MNDVKNKDTEMSNVDRDTITDLKELIKMSNESVKTELKLLFDNLKTEMKSNNDYISLEIKNLNARVTELEAANRIEKDEKSKSWKDIKMDIVKWGITSFIVFALGLIWLWAKNGFQKVW